jgi:hypothetical protein
VLICAGVEGCPPPISLILIHLSQLSEKLLIYFYHFTVTVFNDMLFKTVR